MKNTPGCFLYSQADEFYYYDQVRDVLVIFNLKEARNWFMPIMTTFREVKTSTSGPSGTVFYLTVGRLVTVNIIMKSVNTKIVTNLKLIQKNQK